MSKTEVGDEYSLGIYDVTSVRRFFRQEFSWFCISIEENLVIFKCDICKMTADSGTGLNSHMKAKHIEFRGIIGSWQRQNSEALEEIRVVLRKWRKII